jgi:DNA-binding NarL/FixJ family response regulator
MPASGRRGTVDLHPDDAAQATAADEALHFVQNARDDVHLLLADVALPGMGGLELAAAMLGRFPDLRVLLMADDVEDVASRQGQRKPATPVIGRPFASSILAARIRAILDGREA